LLRIRVDALLSGRATREPPGRDGGYAGAAIGRFDLAGAPDRAALAAAIDACPTGAITVEPGAAVAIDDGRCVMCGLCAEGERAAFRMVAVEPAIGRHRRDLIRRFPVADLAADLTGPDHAGDDAARIHREGAALAGVVRRRLGRSAQIRHLDAGGCNGCDWELNQLQAPTYDLQRFGLDFVASPRHADILLITGVVTRNLELATIRTLDAMPRPRLILAMGACAISGGIFATSYASAGGADRLVAVDAYVAGCPPRPWAVLRGLRLLLEG
jgi:Ni,Fe-hydrogenase III small subunit/ferredoxin